jgi:hypothetical protein
MPSVVLIHGASVELSGGRMLFPGQAPVSVTLDSYNQALVDAHIIAVVDGSTPAPDQPSQQRLAVVEIDKDTAAAGQVPILAPDKETFTLGVPSSVAATPDATATTKGVVRLAGDLAGTATTPTVPGLGAIAGKASQASVDALSATVAAQAVTGVGSVPGLVDALDLKQDAATAVTPGQLAAASATANTALTTAQAAAPQSIVAAGGVLAATRTDVITSGMRVVDGDLASNVAITVTMSKGTTIEYRGTSRGTYAVTVSDGGTAATVLSAVSGTEFCIRLYGRGTKVQVEVLTVGGSTPDLPPTDLGNLLVQVGTTVPGTLTANTLYFNSAADALYYQTGTDLTEGTARPTGAGTNKLAIEHAAVDVMWFQPGGNVKTHALSAGTPAVGSMAENEVRVEIDVSLIETGRLFMRKGGTLYTAHAFTGRSIRRHPYSPTSPWNIGVATTAVLEPDATQANSPLAWNLISKLDTDGSTLTTFLNQDTWSHPVVQARFTDPWVRFESTNASHGESPSDYLPQGGSRAVRLPLGWEAAGGADGHLHVLHPTGWYIDEFIGADVRDRDANGNPTRFSFSRHARVPLHGSGLGPQRGVRAYGGSAIGGLIRAWEIDPNHPAYTGRIDHAIAIALDGAQLFTATTTNPGYNSSGFMTPTNQGYISGIATEADFNYPTLYTGGIPMGSAFTIPTSVNIDTLCSTNGGRMLGHAIQDKGAIVTDQTTGNVVLGYIEPRAPGQFRLDCITDRDAIRSVMRGITNHSSANPLGGAVGSGRRGVAAAAVTSPY